MPYRYEYVSLHSCEHREIIARYAANGWRYIGFVPTQFSGEGGIKEIDLVFEKPEEQAE